MFTNNSVAPLGGFAPAAAPSISLHHNFSVPLRFCPALLSCEEFRVYPANSTSAAQKVLAMNATRIIQELLASGSEISFNIKMVLNYLIGFKIRVTDGSTVGQVIYYDSIRTLLLSGSWTYDLSRAIQFGFRQAFFHLIQETNNGQAVFAPDKTLEEYRAALKTDYTTVDELIKTHNRVKAKGFSNVPGLGLPKPESEFKQLSEKINNCTRDVTVKAAIDEMSYQIPVPSNAQSTPQIRIGYNQNQPFPLVGTATVLERVTNQDWRIRYADPVTQVLSRAQFINTTVANLEPPARMNAHVWAEIDAHIFSSFPDSIRQILYPTVANFTRRLLEGVDFLHRASFPSPYAFLELPTPATGIDFNIQSFLSLPLEILFTTYFPNDIVSFAQDLMPIGERTNEFNNVRCQKVIEVCTMALKDSNVQRFSPVEQGELNKLLGLANAKVSKSGWLDSFFDWVDKPLAVASCQAFMHADRLGAKFSFEDSEACLEMLSATNDRRYKTFRKKTLSWYRKEIERLNSANPYQNFPLISYYRACIARIEAQFPPWLPGGPM